MPANILVPPRRETGRVAIQPPSRIGVRRLFVVACLASGLAGVTLTGGTSAAAASSELLPCTSPRQELNFANYWVGPTFEGLDLSAVIRQCDARYPGEIGRANNVTYVHGDCTPRGGGCALPLSIQSYPAEERTREMYEIGPEELQLDPIDTTVAGHPAARFEGGARLEIYRPDATVVIFGGDRRQVDRVAGALRKGPVVLAQLARYDLAFPEECRGDPRYCVAEPIEELLQAEVSFLVPFVIPGIGFLLGAFVGRWWVVLLPLVGLPGFYAGLYAGWWGYGVGESWQYGLVMFVVIGVAAVGAGWLLGAIIRGRRSSRPVAT